MTLSEGNFGEFEKAFDAETHRSTSRLAAVSDLTDLSAGGLRSSAIVGSARRSKDARARGVGADSRDGLAAARVAARSDGSRMAARASSGTRNIWCQRN